MTLNNPLDNTDTDDKLSKYFVMYLANTAHRYLYNKLLDDLWEDMHTELNDNLSSQIYGELL